VKTQLLEGSGSFVREGEELQPLPPSEYPLGELHEDYLPEEVIRRPGHRGWFAVVDGRGRLRSGMKEFPGWEGWHTLHLVLLPALIGGSETPTLFRSPDLSRAEWPARLKLVSVDGEPTGRVRLRYRVLA
jgi:hypothetical protein